MATYDEIQDATNKAWNSFVDTLNHFLDDDFDESSFYNIADNGICKVSDYVMQASSFGVTCPSCETELDNEDEFIGDGCCYCRDY